MPINTAAASQAAAFLSAVGPPMAAVPVAGPYIALGMQAGAIIASALASSALSVEEAKRQALASVAALIDEIAALPGDIAAQHEAEIEEAIHGDP